MDKEWSNNGQVLNAKCLLWLEPGSTVTSTDRLPKMICEECVYKLDLLFEFREKSVKTESYLEEILKSGEVLHSTCSLAGGLSENVQLPQTVNVENNVNSQEVMHPAVQDTPCTLQTNVTEVLTDTVLGVVTDALPTELHSNVNVILSENLVQNVRSETGVNESSSANIANEVDNNNASRIKCEPDIFIKDEEWASDTSESESDRDDDCSPSEEVPRNATTEESNIETITGTADSNENKEPLVLQEGSNNFMNPAANSLLMLSCPQPLEAQENSNSWLFCNICGKSFTKNEDFQVHYETHYSRCSTCGALFATENALLSHCTEVHAVKGEQKSASASAPTTSAVAPATISVVTLTPTADTSTLAATSSTDPPIATSSENKPASRRKKWEPKVCTECGKQYRTNYKLAEHMRKHTGEKPFQCSMCPKAFRSKIGLGQHEAKHTGQFDYTCNTCGKGFQSKSYLIVHQRVHSDVKPYPCTTCGRNFKTKQALLDHHNRHLGIKPYLCETCGRRFITKGLCKSHQRVHSGTDNKQYPCTVCNKLFVSKSYLSTHLRIHTGEKPFMCEVCGKGFLTRVDLRIHSTMHTGEKSFVCEWCGKAFARRDALRCHRRSHTGERPYSCDVCGQSFTQFSPLTIHKRLHTGERPYVCDICSKAFVSRSTMMSHRKKHTT
ncbi:Protein suppressor of hairy wing [Gryllus bimaculatus]|nr:Protein suppressor of hairy wing [Gryllus bimaculatus]